MIDIHSHIIPNIDDGSKGIEMTLEMLKSAEQNGTKEVFATPHYLLEYGEVEIAEVKELVKDINSLLEEEGINIKVYSGQEVFFTENIVDDFLNSRIGTLNDSRYMLIEFDMREIPSNAFEFLYELQIRGITPIIAHVERYKTMIKEPETINKFINEGCLFQLNSGSITGMFGFEVQKTAELFLKNNVYDFLGSDAHSIGRRNTDMSHAIDIINQIDEDFIDKFLISSRKVIDNEVIEFSGNLIKKKKGLFSIFKRK